MPNEKKVKQVKDLTDKLQKAKAFFLTDYRGLTHQQLEHLKKALKLAEGEFVVVKNTLFKLAFEESTKASKSQSSKEDKEKIETELKNPTATLFAFGDEIAPLKVLADFIKLHQLPKIKIGIFGGKLATSDEFNKFSSLPTREVLLATLAMSLKAPVYGLHYAMGWNLQRLVVALNNVKEKKPDN